MWITPGILVFLVSGVAGFFVSGTATIHSFQPSQDAPAGIDKGRGNSEFSGAGSLELDRFQHAAAQSEAEADRRIAFLKSLAARLQPENYPAAAQSALLWPAREREGFLKAIAQQWARIDARAACTFFFTLEDAGMRVLAAGTVMETWAHTAPGEALQWIKAQPESEWRKEVIESFSRLTEKTDPKQAIAALDLLPGRQRDMNRRRQLALQLSATNPRAAAMAITAASIGEPEREILSQIADRWAQVDLAGALAHLHSLKKDENSDLKDALLAAWGGVNPQGALEWAKQLEAKNRPWRSASIISGWARKNPAAARAYVTALPLGQERDVLMQYLIHELGTKRKDVATIIELHRERDLSRDDMLLSHFTELVRSGVSDSATIAKTIRALPQDERNRKLLGGYFATWSEKNPEEAAAYLEAHASVAENPLAVAAVAKAFASSDPDRAMQWAMKLPSGEARHDAIAGALKKLASTDAERAWSLSQAHLPVARQREIAAGVAGTLARQDVTSAVEWAGRLTDETSRAEAIGAIAGAWGYSDAEACAAWMGKLETGVVRDRAIQGFASRAVIEDPEGALQWAAAISDADRRQSTIVDVAETWHSRYPSAAKRWITSTDLLSPSTKQWLLATKYGQW